ncbi:DctP family TRAP transporter solute-binding subunit [Nesterenkonia halotolerans]|uniref:Tripartite ATP-independent transporter DctP family solute receptor n=1 Tax=Nesterenkonia halotolerans TaxID=225325 RepID=A0ABR9J9Z9_9MICC|nr:DctP family TRAP transporter solute-binding subunit [Nesterenkonia halotolerans]MBE1515824.1 tripartite ATP-independent transporter DctP family solute receptor [Nesterenkonia halotolerans]
MSKRYNTLSKAAVIAALPILGLTACGGGDEEAGGDGGGSGESMELTLAHSYNDDQPQARCGADVIKEEVEAADVGLTIEIFGSSQLGGDADRIASVASGDVDIDIQGASALGAVYEPISVLDAAYAFDDADHLARFMESEEGTQVVEDFAESAGIQTLGAWSAGARHFTSNEPISSPEDLEGMQIRFPGSPQFLMNAEAMGADAVEVAYEELYLSLQQGAVDGQENPITNIESENLNEVQDYLNLSSHQLNTNLVIMSDKWNDLDEEQQEALTSAVESAVTEVTECVATDEEETLTEWRDGGDWEVNDDVDVEAFQEQTLPNLEEALEGDSLATFEAIRSTSE